MLTFSGFFDYCYRPRVLLYTIILARLFCQKCRGGFTVLVIVGIKELVFFQVYHKKYLVYL